MARRGPYFPDTRAGRTGAVRYIDGPNDPGTAMAIGDTGEQMADALNNAFALGEESARAQVRSALGLKS